MRSLPPEGRRMPAAMRPSVDFPQPDSPTMPRTSPGATSRSTSATACTTCVRNPAPNRLAMRPARSTDCTKRISRFRKAHRRVHHASRVPATYPVRRTHLDRFRRLQAGLRSTRTAQWKRTAGGQVQQRWGHSRYLAQRLCRAYPAWESTRSGRACTDASRARSHRRRCPSRQCARHITATRSASPATTARSCVIHIKAVPVSSHSLRIS